MKCYACGEETHIKCDYCQKPVCVSESIQRGNHRFCIDNCADDEYHERKERASMNRAVSARKRALNKWPINLGSGY
jgi:hypothetical protein